MTATVAYLASRRIDAGEELIADYGEAYFKTSSLFGASGILYECDAPELHVASGRGDVDTVRRLLSSDDGASAADLINQRSNWNLPGRH